MSEKPHHPDETRELAFRIWALEAQRRPGKVAEILYRDHGLEVSVRTIQDWKNRYDWNEKVREQMAMLAGPLHQEQIAELFLLAIDGRRFMRQLLQLATEEPEKVDGTYGKSLGALINVALGAQDRAGYSHLGRILARVHEIDNPTIAEAIAGVESLSMEEVVERDRAMVEAEMKRISQRSTAR